MTMIRDAIRDAVADARRRAAEAGELLPEGTDLDALPPVTVQRPTRPEHGDYASNAALQLAKLARRPPLQLAEAIRARLELPDGVAAANVEPPGFLNVRLDDGWVAGRVGEIVDAGEGYGASETAQGTAVNVEFLSANPTGPIHIGNGRGGFIGDVLANVLEATGHRVTREYYVNDYGGQIREFGESVYLARTGKAGEAGYRGAYIERLAEEVPAEALAAVNPMDAIGEWAWNRVFADIRKTLARLRIRFDVFRSERQLHETGQVAEAIERLRSAGHVYESEGATWFRSTAFGDEQDRVLVRSDGRPTYFAADCAYLVDKFGRGFGHLVYVLGPDHHGTLPRWRGAAAGLGYDPQRVEFIIYQHVRLAGGGGMSKRAGTAVSVDELADEVGVDATRFFFAMRSATQHLDFDLDLAKRQSNENPVFYVQYAHARCASILRNAAERKVTADAGAASSLLIHPAEQALLRRLIRLPELLVDAATTRDTHEIAYYCTDLASLFSAFYRDCRVLTDDARLSAARLALVAATRQVLANALRMLGVAAPDSM
jgi:arginyl-tRNA synthetase